MIPILWIISAILGWPYFVVMVGLSKLLNFADIDFTKMLFFLVTIVPIAEIPNCKLSSLFFNNPNKSV